MLRRNPNSVFGPGAHVFPGGAVDTVDSDPNVYARTHGIDDGRASRLVGVANDGLRYWLAAAREAFEESGFLLGSGRAEFHQERDAINSETASWPSALDKHDVEMDLGSVGIFAHWLTPEGSPRRYDTWFLIAAAPDDQEGRHDDNEVVHSEWMRPGEALQRCREKEIDLIFPTLRTLMAIARFSSSARLMATVLEAQRDDVPLVVSEGSGERIWLPGDDHDGARRGWRPLRSRLELDMRLEQTFHDTENVA